MNVPSKTLTYEDMSNYGYTWPGMLPLTKEEAIDIFQNKGLSKMEQKQPSKLLKILINLMRILICLVSRKKTGYNTWIL